MTIFRAYAKVLESDDPAMRLYDAGSTSERSHLRGLDPQTRIVIRAELRYETDEGARVAMARKHQQALATIMPDGMVIAGDAFPTPTTQANRAHPRWRPR